MRVLTQVSIHNVKYIGLRIPQALDEELVADGFIRLFKFLSGPSVYPKDLRIGMIFTVFVGIFDSNMRFTKR
jgi:hypothetical protein